MPVDDVAPPSPQQMAVDSRVEPLELNIAYDLIGLVDGGNGGDLLDRVGRVRRKLASELGFVMPSIRTHDAGDLPSSTYVIRVHGVEVGRGTAPSCKVLVIGDHLDCSPAKPTREPVFGLAARWVPTEYQVQAEMGGNTVVDRSTLVVTHLRDRAPPGWAPAESQRREGADRRRGGDGPASGGRPEHRRGDRRRGAASARAACSTTVCRSATSCASSRPSAIGNARRERSKRWSRRHDPSGPAITSAVGDRGPAHRGHPGCVHRTSSARRVAHLDGVSQLELLPDDADLLVRTLTELVGASAMHGTSPVLVCSAPLVRRSAGREGHRARHRRRELRRDRRSPADRRHRQHRSVEPQPRRRTNPHPPSVELNQRSTSMRTQSTN